MDKPAGQTELRILLLEDVPTDAELMENALREAGLSFTAKRVDTREAFIRALEEFKPDIVLADYKLPTFDGASAVKIVRQQYPTVPVVMVTGTMGDEKAIELLKLGARDYVLKDRLVQLGPAVQRALSVERGIRARKAAEQALRQSEADLRALVEHSPIAMLVDVGVDADEKIVMMNQKFTELFGYTMADVPDVRHWWPLAYTNEKYREELKVEWIGRVEKAIQSHGDIEPMETTVTCKDGSNRYVRISLSSIGNKNIITFEDLTERKRMGDALKEAADRNQAIMETANDAIICMKPDGLIHLWNHKAEELFGYTAKEAVGQELHQLIVPERYREKALEGLRQFVQTGAGYVVGKTLELTAWRKDRIEFPIELSISPMNIRGEWHATGIIRDITERKQAEDALRLHSEILKTLSEGITLIRASDGIIVFGNLQVERLFGYEPDELLGKHVSIENAPDEKSPEAVAAAIMSELTQTGKWSGEVHNIKKDGTTFWCHASVSSFDHPQFGKSWVTVHEDITERKQAEMRVQKLTRLYATLSQTNGIIVRTTNRKELLCSICKAAVNHGKFVLAWWGLLDETTHMIKPICHYGAEDGYLTDIVVSADDVPAGRGPTGTAIRENCVSYVNDYATDERVLPWREAALKRGFRGAAGLPLRFGNKVIGVLTLYTEEPDFFDADQLNLLNEMATDISFALEGFEREALRQLAEGERETALQKLRKALEGSIGLAAAISEKRDPYTAGHQQRVGQLAEAIAVEMGLSQAQAEGIRFGSMIHDIGKIGVPAEILSKPSRLTPLELQLVQTHARSGYEIVKDIEFPWPVAQMILQHHERLDGSGYPAGLKGNDILLEARIIAVADTVEAMSSHRPYRPGLGMDAALTEITGASGVRYDPQAVEACLRLIKEKDFTFKAD